MAGELDQEQLRALAAAVSEGTFEAAARALQITPSAVSQRIRALEERTGRVLLRRSKPVTPTESGTVLLRAARQLEVIAADVWEQLGGDRAGGIVVCLAVNADSLATWLLPALAAVASELSLDLRRADQLHTAELLRDGSVVAAVTAAREPLPGCTSTPLGVMRYRACAAPAFLARWLPSGPSAEALAQAPVVIFDRQDQLQDAYLRGRCRRPVSPPRHHIPGSGAFVSAIELGIGWGMVPDLQSAHPLRRGSLVSFDDRHPIDVPLYWQQSRLRSDSLDRVARAVQAAAAASLIAG